MRRGGLMVFMTVSSVHAPLAAAPVVLAHVLARELSIAVLRQLRHEVDGARPLEVRQPPAAEVHDLAVIRAGTISQNDNRSALPTTTRAEPTPRASSGAPRPAPPRGRPILNGVPVMPMSSRYAGEARVLLWGPTACPLAAFPGAMQRIWERVRAGDPDYVVQVAVGERSGLSGTG